VVILNFFELGFEFSGHFRASLFVTVAGPHLCKA
jgi:hypothetical protein